MNAKTKLHLATQANATPLEPYVIDLNCHVFPLLNAINWIGLASQMLSEIQSLAEHRPELKALLRGIARPDPINAGEIVSSLSWVAEDLLLYSQSLDEVHTSG